MFAQHEYDLYFYVKRGCLLFSVTMKLFFEFFVMREKPNYFCVKVFPEEVQGTLWLVDRQQVSLQDKVTLFETMTTIMNEVNRDKTKAPD